MRQCPFLRLPAELRNEIYRMVIGGHFITISRSNQGRLRFHTVPYPTDLAFHSNLHVTYLSQVCHQSHHDTAGLHCALNTFIAITSSIPTRQLRGISGRCVSQEILTTQDKNIIADVGDDLVSASRCVRYCLSCGSARMSRRTSWILPTNKTSIKQRGCVGAMSQSRFRYRGRETGKALKHMDNLGRFSSTNEANKRASKSVLGIGHNGFLMLR
jgi:hypothetical protein